MLSCPHISRASSFQNLLGRILCGFSQLLHGLTALTLALSSTLASARESECHETLTSVSPRAMERDYLMALITMNLFLKKIPLEGRQVS